MTIIEKATDFAQNRFVESNAGFGHSRRVGEILQKEFFITDEEIIAAGILHDILEDTNTTEDDLKQFSSKIVEYVKDLSHPKNFPDSERKKFYEHLLTISDEVKIIKLADLLDSLRWMISIYESGEQDKYPKFINNDKYIIFIRKFLNTCPDGLPKNLVIKIVDQLEKMI